MLRGRFLFQQGMLSKKIRIALKVGKSRKLKCAAIYTHLHLLLLYVHCICFPLIPLNAFQNFGNCIFVLFSEAFWRDIYFYEIKYCYIIINTQDRLRFLLLFMILTMSIRQVRPVGRGCLPDPTSIFLEVRVCFAFNLYFAIWIVETVDQSKLFFNHITYATFKTSLLIIITLFSFRLCY